MEVLLNDGPHGSLNRFPRSDESALLLDPRLSPAVRGQLHTWVSTEFAREATLWIASSGSTARKDGLPKLVALSQRAIESSCRAVNLHLHMQPEDVILSALPDFHVGGVMLQKRALLAGCAYRRTVGNNAPWNAALYFEALHESRATISSLVPAQLFDLIRAKYAAPATLRAVVIGGQALAPALYSSARQYGWPILPSYGMTEAASQIATAALSSLTTSTAMLQLLPHMHARANNEGLLEVRSESLCDGWLEWKESERTPRFYSMPADAWFCTNDYGAVYDHTAHYRTLVVKGRSSDMIKIGGELVNRGALDEVLIEIMAEKEIRGDSALMCVTDERLGHALELHATSQEEAAKICEEFNQRVQPAARVRAVKIVSAIPRTALGKLLMRSPE